VKHRETTHIHKVATARTAHPITLLALHLQDRILTAPTTLIKTSVYGYM